MTEHNFTTVASAVPSGVLHSACSKIALRTAHPTVNRIAGFTLKQRGRSRGFTLAELVVTVGVLVLLVLLFTQLLTSTATVTTLGHKQMDADAQARQLLDRMAVDFAQMVKRSDLDFFAKRTNTPNSRGGAMAGNDGIAFYSAVPGYYPAAGSQSPVSLVAYRLNSNSARSAYNKMERMGKGLVWNGVSTTDTPVVFMPIKIENTWSAATSSSTADPAYEVIGPQVFRFEYYYLLKNGNFSDTPWITPTHDSVSGMQDVSAIVVDIAVIDAKSKVLLTDAQIATLGASLSDYTRGMVPGQLRTSWQNTLNANTSLPRPALSGIRLYERFVYLSPPVL
jgi:type II secretory pathway component PulJ